MQLGEYFFDGDKRCIYEAPTVNFQFTTDGNGYRIYTPIDESTAPKVIYNDMRILWSRYVDFMDALPWPKKVFEKTGGASRGLDGEGNETFATIDFFIINNWKLVPANYLHDSWWIGNVLAKDTEHPLSDFFDVSRQTVMHAIGVRGADSFQSYVINGATNTDIEPPVWVGTVGVTDVYQVANTIKVRWGAATDISGFVQYNLYLSDNILTVWNNKLTSTQANLVTIDNSGVGPLESGTNYYFGVRAEDKYGNEDTNTNIDMLTFSDYLATVSLSSSSVQEVVTAISEVGYTNDVANNQIVQLDRNGLEIARFNCFNEAGQSTLSNIKTMVLAT